LPLAILRRFADGSLSPSEFAQWYGVVAQMIAEAGLAEDEEVWPS